LAITTRVATARPENGGGVGVGAGAGETEGDGESLGKGESLGIGESEGDADGEAPGNDDASDGDTSSVTDELLGTGDGVAGFAQALTMTASAASRAARRWVRARFSMAPEW
jgi:hypothetical protein